MENQLSALGIQQVDVSNFYRGRDDKQRNELSKLQMSEAKQGISDKNQLRELAGQYAAADRDKLHGIYAEAFAINPEVAMGWEKHVGAMDTVKREKAIQQAGIISQLFNAMESQYTDDMPPEKKQRLYDGMKELAKENHDLDLSMMPARYDDPRTGYARAMADAAGSMSKKSPKFGAMTEAVDDQGNSVFVRPDDQGGTHQVDGFTPPSTGGRTFEIDRKLKLFQAAYPEASEQELLSMASGESKANKVDLRKKALDMVSKEEDRLGRPLYKTAAEKKTAADEYVAYMLGSDDVEIKTTPVNVPMTADGAVDEAKLVAGQSYNTKEGDNVWDGAGWHKKADWDHTKKTHGLTDDEMVAKFAETRSAGVTDAQKDQSLDQTMGSQVP